MGKKDEGELFGENVIEDSENDAEAEVESESLPNCAGVKKKENIQSSEISEEDAYNDLAQNEGTNEEDSEEEDLVKAKECKKKKKKKGGLKNPKKKKKKKKKKKS